MEKLPGMFDFLTERLLQRQIYDKSPNSIIVNEYEAGQGIMPHVDAPKLFGKTITALSMLSACVMTFQHVKDPSQVYHIHLRNALISQAFGYMSKRRIESKSRWTDALALLLQYHE
jgi:alkylated DNA repair dioxygenase AlkB